MRWGGVFYPSPKNKKYSLCFLIYVYDVALRMVVLQVFHSTISPLLQAASITLTNLLILPLPCKMETFVKVSRPLSLSSDDLLHEAERMSAAKFISRFPSSEKINLAHLSDDALKTEAPSLLRMEWNSITEESIQTFSSLSTSTLISDTNTYNNDDAPTIEGNEKDDSFQTVIAQEHVGLLTIEKDPHGPLEDQKKVDLVIFKWGPVEPINPERFFLKLLSSRGYEISTIPALNSHYCR